MIHLQNIRKSYKNDADASPVLSFDTWQLEAGERVALMGESGSGKTTLLNLLSGLLIPDSGVVEIDGTDLAKLSEAQRDRFRAGHIGYVFQTFHLLEGYTVLENVELGALFAKGHLEEGRADALLKLVGLGERKHYLPSQLSVGQQARVAFARALVNKPKILLADEPTGALDRQTGHQVLDLMLKTAIEQGITVVCATHDSDVASAFERTVRVEELR
ncbi:MAG: ABC transporter ATP-binding protein [Planctomycetota bacterium]|nr:ABC transporter ATP-binding protein [Planctomycetota bacterium]MDA1113172.1 ABC transporter ATP-binding protein [Planctomycetota bacterium]